MASDDHEERRLRSVALQNAKAILIARQRAERELAAERERLRITLASIGDAVISTDAEGRVIYLNTVAEVLTGWTQDEALGRPLPDVFQIVNEDTRQTAENPALQALRQGVVVGLANHTILIARDGTERPIDDSAAPMLDESGTPVGVVLVFRDVTERRRAEEVQARLAAIVESSQDAIVSKTLDSIIRTWNAGAERLFGYRAEEAVGRSITLIIPPERLGEEQEILARLARGERIEHYETVRMAKDGRRLDISLTISPIRDAEGRVIGASKVARDVTERKRAEEALRASEQRFRALTAHAPVGIFLADREGNCLFVNECWCEITGLSPEEARGQGWARALHPDDRERIFHEWYAAAEAGQPFAGEYRFRTPEGRVTWVQGRAVGRRDEAGQVREYIGTVMDITERREAVEALKEADRRKDEFLALLAHELRNPLAPLRNGLQVMRLASGDADIVARSRDMMDRQLSHMVRLIDDLLDVSRISRNKMELRRSRVLLADVVSSAVETARPVLEAAGHELTVSLPPEPVHLDADLTRLAQVFGNLLNNSAKYTERGGHIWLTATRQGDQVSVAVRDTGIGIPAFALPSIFDMFSQVDRSIERSTGGLGIGLALVKGLVEMHGGTVEAASPGQGKGSTFTVRLPVLKDRAELPRTLAEAWPESSGAKRRILVVDDNQDSASSMAMMLQLLGNEVRSAHDGAEALELAEQFRPQVVLMDIGMPRLNGYEATRRIRERPWGRDIAVIALTGWSQEMDRAKSKEAGCDGHLVKPVTLPALEKLLAELQGGRSSPPSGPALTC
ncbi:MAG TPA: PAS domain S-box protein [Thermoanaerobaculia bacterium]|jgi:PAS domain S-box-containing protein|nr:PAS domain S-box protein [Thermoanaerobaculia bacterium]